MKQLLLVLLALGVSMPASADVHVYNMKTSNAEYKYNSDSNALEQVKDTNTAFVIFELPGGGSANVWGVYTYKAKDPNGKTQNYCKGENRGTLGFEHASLSPTNAKWVISDAANGRRIILTGDVNTAKIRNYKSSCNSCHDPSKGTPTFDITSPFAGYSIKDRADANDANALSMNVYVVSPNEKVKMPVLVDVSGIRFLMPLN
ncbi:MAG: hypothetical protein ABSB11_01765 [Sedimentisphaerales bacterium]|jgi:hypothetical protein